MSRIIKRRKFPSRQGEALKLKYGMSRVSEHKRIRGTEFDGNGGFWWRNQGRNFYFQIKLSQRSWIERIGFERVTKGCSFVPRPRSTFRILHTRAGTFRWIIPIRFSVMGCAAPSDHRTRSLLAALFAISFVTISPAWSRLSITSRRLAATISPHPFNYFHSLRVIRPRHPENGSYEYLIDRFFKILFHLKQIRSLVTD